MATIATSSPASPSFPSPPPSSSSPSYSTVRYTVDPVLRCAHILLSRPSRSNAINWPMPAEIAACVERANEDSAVNTIVIEGDGPVFCAGYDLKEYAEKPRGTMEGSQYNENGGYDPFTDYLFMKKCTDCYMALFHSYKPTIAKVRGYAVGGGSDIALCCDFVYMERGAKIGYPPARLWGSPTTNMWIYRLPLEKAKRMLFTGDLVTGEEAEKMGLILQSCEPSQLDQHVNQMVKKLSQIPVNQLFIQKQVCNQSIEGQLMANQRLSNIMDGLTRHTPEGVDFQRMCEKEGFQQAVKKRDAMIEKYFSQRKRQQQLQAKL